MGIAACMAGKCGKAIEYAHLLPAQARGKCGRKIGVPANVRLTSIITL